MVASAAAAPQRPGLRVVSRPQLPGVLADLQDVIRENDRLTQRVEQLERQLATARATVGQLRSELRDRQRQIDELRAGLVLARNGQLETEAGSRRVRPRKPTLNSMGISDALARVRETKTKLRRVELTGGAWFDVPARLLRRGPQRVTLSPSEYLILVCLAERRGERIDRDDLTAFVFGTDRFLETRYRSLSARLVDLRRKLGRLGARECLPADRVSGYVLLEAC